MRAVPVETVRADRSSSHDIPARLPGDNARRSVHFSATAQRDIVLFAGQAIQLSFRAAS